MLRSLAMAAAGMMAMATVVQAATLRVPQEYSTISAALDASQDGDEIVVGPGLYLERLEINRHVLLRSTFDGENWDMVANTIIKPPPSMNNVPAILPGAGMPTIRGFLITRNPIPVPPPGTGTRAVGILGNANIEYCIIENQVNMPAEGGAPGAAVISSAGTIKNNIIRNNHSGSGGSAFYGCSGSINNNIIYGNSSVAIATCSGPIFNNTLYNNTSGFSGCVGPITSNIVWWDTPGDHRGVSINSSVPNYCIIRDYQGGGVGNIDDNPRFVSPETGDFRLQADSPCIDAGGTSVSRDLKADFNGVQRGLKALSVTKGDGSGVDIGAYEFIPKPVGVWLPGGGPDEIRAGDAIEVAWEMDLDAAGTGIVLQLFDETSYVTSFGAFWNPAGADRNIVALPSWLPTCSTYRVTGVSSWNAALSSASAFFTITHPNGGCSDWSLYE